MKVLEKLTGKEIKKGDVLKRALFAHALNDFSRVETKEVTFQGIASCGKKIMVKEHTFGHNWTLSHYPSSFNLEITKEISK